MNKLKKIFSMPSVTIAAFVLAAILLLTSGIGGARAALTYYSENYTARVSMSNIGVTLNENGEAVSYRDYEQDGDWSQETGTLLGKMLDEDAGGDGNASVKIGKTYPEELSVTNSGDISQYVRVSVFRYWCDAEGNKNREVSPAMIGLKLGDTDISRLAPDTGWLVDEDASTSERTVLYYNRVLAPGETTTLFADSLTIDRGIAAKVTRTEEENADGAIVITTTYDYDGYSFCVEAKVDAVQEHNAEDAVYSAWGRDVSISGGTLSLK